MKLEFYGKFVEAMSGTDTIDPLVPYGWWALSDPLYGIWMTTRTCSMISREN